MKLNEYNNDLRFIYVLKYLISFKAYKDINLLSLISPLTKVNVKVNKLHDSISESNNVNVS